MAGFRLARALGAGLLIAGAPRAASAQAIEAPPFNPALARTEPLFTDRPAAETKTRRSLGPNVTSEPEDVGERRR